MRKIITFFVFIFCFQNFIQSQILVPKENIISNYPLLTDNENFLNQTNQGGTIPIHNLNNIYTFDFDLNKFYPINQLKIYVQNPYIFDWHHRCLKIYTASSNFGPWTLIDSFVDYNFLAGNASQVFKSHQLLLNNCKISRFWRLEVHNNGGSFFISEFDFFYNTSLINNSNSGVLLNDNCTNLTAFANNESYLWSTGETTQSINVCNSGTYTGIGSQ